MPLIVEDGSIVVGADSYVSTDAADTYHSDRANTAWAAATASAKEAALRKATSYIDTKYAARLRGFRVSATQPLRWPRTGVELDDLPFGSLAYLDYTTIPQSLKDATCEAAIRFLAGDLSPDMPRGGKIESINVAGAISKKFMTNAPGATSYPVIDRLLAPLLNSPGTQLVRS